jgi:thiol-disulfide isomerase/thioredoxin
MFKLTFVLVFWSVFCYAQPKLGIWRGVLSLNPKERIDLPFNFEIKKTNKSFQIIIHNAQERIIVDEVVLHKDSFNFKMPVFDTEFRTKLVGDSMLSGIWINHTKKDNNIITFNANANELRRFIVTSNNTTNFYEGKWEVTFSPNTIDSSKAIGMFTYSSNNEKVYGTFLTETGDYRYLEGVEFDDKLYLSCFDGSHAFLFSAEKNEKEIINSNFYSGSTWHEKWIAKRNENFELRDPEKLTFIKDPNTAINFSFYNIKNEKISLSDKKFQNKAVIIQIMGSWCPNCMDESAYLSEVYKKYNKKGLEIIALAYERTSDTERAKLNLQRLSKRFDIGYEILFTGLTGKDKASESLPFLNGIMAFPTTVFLDPNHVVKSIYTGFSGPATGKAYNEYTIKTEKLINELILKEK